MKSIAASIFLIALLAQTGTRYMVILDYAINKDFIAQNLCINRDKPMSGCNGKCYLKKQLDKAAKEQASHGNNTRDDRAHMLFLQHPKKITTYFFAEQANRQYLCNQSSFTPQDLYRAVFHPPQPANLYF